MRVNFWNLETLAASSWEQARGYLVEDLRRLQATINTVWTVAHAVDGTQLAGTRGSGDMIVGTMAEQPTSLNAGNDGLLLFVSDFGHLVRYNASLELWQFAPGDVGNGFLRDYAIAPQEVGWALCDGSATTRLVVGATLTSAAFTTPNLTGTPAYKKAIAAYTGTINAASGGVVSGSTAGGTTGTDNTGNNNPGTDAQGAHTHTYSGSTSNESFDTDNVPLTGATTVAAKPHDHTFSGTTSSDGSHSHTVDSHLHSIPGLSIPALGAGTLAVSAVSMANLGVLPYFRR